MTEIGGSLRHEKMQLRDRRWAILNEVQQKHLVNVCELSREYGVSEVVIRHDLDHLDGLGLLRRTHGGARCLSTNVQASIFEARLLQNRPVKQALGQAAARLIQPGDTALLDAGTTILEVARHIQRQVLESGSVTIATRSLLIASELRMQPQIRLIVIGGIYDRNYDDFVGLQVENTLSGIHFDILFLGVDGLTVERGISTNNILEVGLYRIMAKISDRVVVVADSSKIGLNALQVVLPFNQIHTLVTDNHAPDKFVENVKAHGVEVIQVTHPLDRQSLEETLR